MIERLNQFVRALRDAGCEISPSEVIDAERAVAAIPLDRRDVLASGLAASVCKDHLSRPVFDRLFSVFFPSGTHSLGEMDDEEVIDAVGEGLMEPGQDLAHRAGQAVDQFAGMTPGRSVSGVYYAYRTGRSLDFDQLEIQLRDVLEPALGSYEAEREARRRIAAMRRLIDEEVLERLVADRGSDAVAATLGLKLIIDEDIMRASGDELAALRSAIAPLAAKLATRLERRHRTRNRGSLDVRRTMRASLSTGGVPVVPHTHAKRVDRPEIVLLADISGSVASFARFTLLLLYALSQEFRRLRAFAFIDAIDEVTQYLESTGVDEAIRVIGSSARVIGNAGHSDYGAAFRSFLERYREALTPRTTLIVCGDARSNYHDLGGDSFADMCASVRATYWLNPEPSAYWDTGDSVISRFGCYCTDTRECRTLRQLERFVTEAL